MYEADMFRRAYDPYWLGVHALHPPAVQPPGRTPPEPLGRPIRMPGPDSSIGAVAERNRPPGAGTASHLQAREAVEGLKRMFVAKASGLLSTGVLPIPPGHPLYDGHRAIAALEAERDGLLKENADLKRRLEKHEAGSGHGLPQQQQQQQ
ncbi:MAG: hypothetical protein OXK17_08655 [Thaumarchaeota archaeon]|nr:hypothetical protein [Nitrososphaerota archaeon]